MKKQIVALLGVSLACASLYADSWLQGSITQVKENEKVIIVDTAYSGQVAVKILPNTKVELDNCGWFGLADSWIFSDYGDFWDLKVGRFVEVDAYLPAMPQNVPNATTATKVEVKCRPKAY